MHHCSRASWIVVILLSIVPATAIASESTPTVSQANRTLASQPIAFTKNMGQWSDSVLFRADIGEAVMWIVKDGIYYQFTKRIARLRTGEEASAMGLGPRLIDPMDRHHERDSIETTMIKAEFVGANPDAEVLGLEEMDYKCNYFIGNDPAKWRTDVPNYSGVTFKELYPGVDASFGEREGRLECRLTAASDGDLAHVRTEYSGAGVVTRETESRVSIKTLIGEKQIAGILPLEETGPARATVVSSESPNAGVSLLYSTYIGGWINDGGVGIAVDGDGNAYLTGSTVSADFPTQYPYQTDPGDGAENAFVTKFSAAGISLLYSTYLGGGSNDYGHGITVDGANCVYVTGTTGSTNFPTRMPYQTDPGDGAHDDVFVTKLSAAGNSLLYSTYLGGRRGEQGYGIAVDGSGNAYVTGETRSTDFPIQNPYQTDPGDYTADVFVTKLSAAGNSLLYSSYLGGGSDDRGAGIAVDGSGSAYVTGFTSSTNFPTQNPYQTTNRGNSDVFVTKLSAAGNSLLYSSYLGGGGDDRGAGIAVDGSGSAYVTGETFSANFPIQNPYQTDSGDYTADVFVTKLSAAGNSLLYSTYLGGDSYDIGCGIAVDGSGNAYVTGRAYSTNFPTQNSYQTYQGYADAFVTRLSAAGNNLYFSTYLGGESDDYGSGVAVDDSGNAYVTGTTLSVDFPTQSPYQTDLGDGALDAFVTKLMFVSCCTPDSKLRGDVSICGGSCPDGDGVTDPSDLQSYIDLVFFGTYLDMNPSVFTESGPGMCAVIGDLNNDAGIDGGDLGVIVDYVFLGDTSVILRCDGSPF